MWRNGKNGVIWNCFDLFLNCQFFIIFHDNFVFFIPLFPLNDYSVLLWWIRRSDFTLNQVSLWAPSLGLYSDFYLLSFSQFISLNFIVFPVFAAVRLTCLICGLPSSAECVCVVTPLGLKRVSVHWSAAAGAGVDSRQCYTPHNKKVSLVLPRTVFQNVARCFFIFCCCWSWSDYWLIHHRLMTRVWPLYTHSLRLEMGRCSSIDANRLLLLCYFSIWHCLFQICLYCAFNLYWKCTDGTDWCHCTTTTTILYCQRFYVSTTKLSPSMHAAVFLVPVNCRCWRQIEPPPPNTAICSCQLSTNELFSIRVCYKPRTSCNNKSI